MKIIVSDELRRLGRIDIQYDPSPEIEALIKSGEIGDEAKVTEQLALMLAAASAAVITSIIKGPKTSAFFRDTLEEFIVDM